MSTTTQLLNIPVKDITPLKNYRDVAPPSAKDADVIELSESIKEKGLLQPVLVRQSTERGKPEPKYELVFGNRRFLAAQLAGMTEIPCNVKDVSDDEVLDLQVTENMQRKDVHPMDEALAFVTLVQKKKYTTAELCSRFGKKEDYVLQRLKLNDLIPELQTKFRKDEMLLGHALLLCRLQPADQKEALKSATGQDFRNETVNSIKEWIDDEVMRDLNKCGFSLADPDLNPKAGPCATCNKRSGAGNLLFADMASDNRCFDGTCFEIKSDAAFMQTLTQTIDTNPEILLLKSHQDLSKPIQQMVKDMKLKVLKEYDDYKTSDWDSSFQIKAKGLYLNGFSRGKTVTIYLKGKKNSSVSAATGQVVQKPAEIIAGIKERNKRAAELDEEKVHAKLLEAIKKNKSFKTVDAKQKDLTAAEMSAMVFLVLSASSGYRLSEICKSVGIPNGITDNYSTGAEKKFTAAREISTGQLAALVRIIMLENFSGTTKTKIHGYIMRKLAEQFKDIDIASIDKEQAEIRAKRDARAAERIAALQKPTKKEPAKTVSVKAAKKAVQKLAKKSSSKKVKA